MGLIETAGESSIWKGMDYYNEKKVIFWEQTGQGIYGGLVSGSEGRGERTRAL